MIDNYTNSAIATNHERDIDLLLITGAGASREFGKNNQPMPLMGDWVNVLVDKLFSKNSLYSEASGLRKDMTGPEFEEQLGLFLRQVAFLSILESLLEPSCFFPPVAMLPNSEQIKTWHKNTVFHLEEIVGVIRESLYEEFSSEKSDIDKATKSYRQLFEVLGITSGSQLVYATTNYDLIGETAIGKLGYLPDWGVAPHLVNMTEPPLYVDNILDGMPRYVPVLHLHGRIGWYRRTDFMGKATPPYCISATKYNKDLGTPIVMLPDPDKTYDKDDVISSTWRQFTEALRRAKAVLVLGHSLHDKTLVETIRSNVDPRRVGITILPSEDRMGGQDGNSTGETIEQIFGNNAKIIMRFGSEKEDEIRQGQENLGKWQNMLEDLK